MLPNEKRLTRNVEPGALAFRMFAVTNSAACYSLPLLKSNSWDMDTVKSSDFQMRLRPSSEI